MLCTGNTYKRFLSLTTIVNIKHARNSFSSLTTENKISVASEKNHAVCARLKLSHVRVHYNILGPFIIFNIIIYALGWN